MPAIRGGLRRAGAPIAIACAMTLTACAGVGSPDSGDRGDKVLVTRGAWQLLQENAQATAVFKRNADQAPQAELICERILMAGKRIRTLCYARKEEVARIRDHREKFQEMVLIPGSGG